MSKLLSFAKLATAYFNSGAAPEKIEFTQADVLQTSVEALSHASELEELDVSPNKDVTEHVADFEVMTKDRLHNGEMLKPFDDMGNAFAKKLYSGITNLKQVKKDVSTITEDILARFKNYVAADPVVAAYTGEHDLSGLSMESINWDLLNSISERAIIAKVHDKLKYDDAVTITPSLIAMAINTLPGVVDDRTCEAATLQPEKVDRIVDAVHASVKDRFTKDEVTSVVRSTIYLSKDHLNQAVNGLKAFANGNNVDKINQFMKLVRLNDAILPYITDEVTDASAANRKRINNNIEMIKEISQMTAYLAINYRNQVWKDAIIVPGPMVNPDNAKDFLTKGGTISKLVQYYNYAYKATGVPVAGVNLQFTLDSLGKVDAEYKAEAARQASICEDRKKDYLRSSFINSGIAYLEGHKDNYSKGFVAADLPRFVAATYDAVGNDTPLESRVYDMIFNSCFINSIERNLYTRLSAAYLKHAKSTETLTDEMCDRIDVSVYADMIADYLVEKGILVTE